MSAHTACDCLAGCATALLVYAGFTVAPPRAAPAPEPRVIEVVARRFAFVPARIEVALGETVRLVVRSADGMHGLQIKKLKVTEEIPRGNVPVVIEFTATAEGEFDIACSQYCGKGHEGMRGTLVVRARDARAR